MREQWIPGTLLPHYRVPGNEAMFYIYTHLVNDTETALLKAVLDLSMDLGGRKGGGTEEGGLKGREREGGIEEENGR